jgi:hypothetical protein
MLLGAGAIDQHELDTALEEQRRTGERLGVVLARRGVDPERIARTLARQLRLPHVTPPLLPQPGALRCWTAHWPRGCASCRSRRPTACCASPWPTR